jgi:hypothetical protein
MSSPASQFARSALNAEVVVRAVTRGTGVKAPMKKGVLSYVGNKTGVFVEDSNIQGELNEEQVRLLNAVGETLHAYRKAVKKLLAGKYAHVRHLVPPYLAELGKVIVVGCHGGIVVRYERAAEVSPTLAAWTSDSIADVMALQSQKVIKCHTASEYDKEIADEGITLTLSAHSAATGQTRVLSVFRFRFDAVLTLPAELPKAPHKPLCLLSVRNEFEIGLEIVETVTPKSGAQERRALLRNSVRAPVGWECVELYPIVDPRMWNPEYASQCLVISIPIVELLLGMNECLAGLPVITKQLMCRSLQFN